MGAPNILFGPGPAAAQALNAVLDEATVGICAEALGVLRRLYDATVAYLRQRSQFGTPLAQFQVLRHQLVDMHMEITKSASITALADRRLDSPRRMRELMTSAAKWQVSRACRAVGEAAIQLHGAIGTTEELELGDYFKRALVISEQFGSAEFHRRRFQQLSFAAGD